MPKVKPRQPLWGHDNTAQAQRDLMHATHVALRWLPQRWPAVFPDDTKQIHPLAIGVRDQVLEAIETEPNAPDAGIVLRALGIWTKSGPYVTAAAKGRDRLNLDGSVASPISDTHRACGQRVLDERKARQRSATAPKIKHPIMFETAGTAYLILHRSVDAKSDSKWTPAKMEYSTDSLLRYAINWICTNKPERFDGRTT